MFESFIPNALAAASTATKNSAASVLTSSADGAGGLSGLFTSFTVHIPNLIGGIIVIVVFYFIGKIASQKTKEKIITIKGEDVQENVLVLVERVTKMCVLLIGIIIAGAMNGLNLAMLIGAISLGIGFAIKDVIANFIASIVMLAQNQIRIGDFVQIADILGTIVNINTRATTIQSIDGTQVIVPNQIMLNQILTSFSTNPFRRIQIDIGIDYYADIDITTKLIKGVVDKHPDVVAKPPSTVFISDFGESAILLRVFFWIESKKPWQQIRSNIAYRIRKALAEAGVNIPFPIRTLKLDEDDRAFLKTIDSARKGIVPEPKKILEKEELRHIAESTEHAPVIPGKLFEEKQEVKPNPDIKTETSIRSFKEKQENPTAGTPPTHI